MKSSNLVCSLIDCLYQAPASPMSEASMSIHSSKHTTPEISNSVEEDETSKESIESRERNEWAAMEDPVERRRIQNRNAQRKFRMLNT